MSNFSKECKHLKVVVHQKITKWDLFFPVEINSYSCILRYLNVFAIVYAAKFSIVTTQMMSINGLFFLHRKQYMGVYMCLCV